MANPAGKNHAPSNSPASNTSSRESFYEIEYDTSPFPGVGKFVLKSQEIEPPKKDEVRELFYQMREIAREDRFLHYNGYNDSRFYDRKVQQENARIFYKQGMFMKDFEDNFEKQVPFSSYFPNYQMMGYEQLRTYFTWRTRIRKGEIANISLSYAFLYLYELLNNIGVDSPQDGMEKLMFFWNAFRVYDQTIDKYVIKWLKDYHIYYDLPWSFRTFIIENNLGSYYPKVVTPDDNFDLYCAVSKYDIRKSKFYNDDNVGLIRDCFNYVIHQLRKTFSENQILLDDFVFQPAKNMTLWIPFGNALFYPGLRHPDKRVVLSEKEIYIRRQNKWMFHTTITTESGKQLVGYVLKQMESVLRKSEKYKYKLSASIDSISPIIAGVLAQAGISLEQLVTESTLEFYREATKTVVTVNPKVLDKIRQESLMTQEKLIVPEQEEEISITTSSASASTAMSSTLVDMTWDGQYKNPMHSCPMPTNISPGPLDAVAAFPGPLDSTAAASADPWKCLADAYDNLEKQALLVLWGNQTDNTKFPSYEQFAQQHNIMPEVLIDSINEKTMDYIGDSLLDGEFHFYEDYIEQVKGMVKHIWQDKYPQE